MNKTLILLLILVASLLFRVTPPFIYGHPTILDGWMHTYHAIDILKTGRIEMKMHYYMHWPLVNLVIAFSSLISGYDCFTSGSLIPPFIASFTPLLLYLIVRRGVGDWRVGLVAAFILAFSGFHILVTGGTWKETLAHYLYKTVTLSLLLWFSRRDVKTSLVMILLFTGLVLDHHAISLIELALIGFLLLNLFIADWYMGGLSVSDLIKASILYVVLVVIALYYYYTHAVLFAIVPALTFDTLIRFLSYAFIFTLISIHTTIKGHNSRLLSVALLLIWFWGFLGWLAFVTGYPLFYGLLENAPQWAMVLLFPYVIVGFFATRVVRALRDVGIKGRAFMFGYASVIATLMAFVFFSGAMGAPPNFGLAYRLSSFFLVALSIVVGPYIAVLLSRLWRARKGKVISAIICVCIILLCLPAVFGHYLGVLAFGYFNIYDRVEVHAYKWIHWHVDNIYSIAGDYRVTYAIGAHSMYYLGNYKSEVDFINTLSAKRLHGFKGFIINSRMVRDGFMPSYPVWIRLNYENIRRLDSCLVGVGRVYVCGCGEVRLYYLL